MSKNKNKGLKSFTIDYKKWGRGSLLDANGKMCCLGFCAMAAGLGKGNIFDVGLPSGLPDEEVERFPEFLFSYDDESYLATINDSGAPTELKIAMITKRFRRYGIKVLWKNVPKEIRKAADHLMKDRAALDKMKNDNKGFLPS